MSQSFLKTVPVVFELCAKDVSNCGVIKVGDTTLGMVHINYITIIIIKKGWQCKAGRE